MGARFLLLGALSALLAVLLGAFGAHALSGHLDGRLLEVYATASEYHFYHSLGLLLIGLLAHGATPSRLLAAAGWLLVLGLVLFCGSLYLLAITGLGWLGAITPVGGVAFITAWAALALWSGRLAARSGQ